MEMLAAMMMGAVGAVAARGFLRRIRGVWPATVLGIFGGWGVWWLLQVAGPGDKAGPLLLWHAVAGAAGGAGVAALAGAVLGRLAK